jgi:hypothetical protein
MWRTDEEKIQNQINELMQRKKVEERVHKKTEDFLNMKKEKINEDSVYWMKKVEDDLQAEDDKLNALAERR